MPLSGSTTSYGSDLFSFAQISSLRFIVSPKIFYFSPSLRSGDILLLLRSVLQSSVVEAIGTLRFATARCCYGYEKSNLLPVMSAHALQYGFPAVPCFSTTAKYFVWRSPQYVSISFHFHAIFMIISLFSEVKFKD